MLKNIFVCLCVCLCVVVSEKVCYWNNNCQYQLYSSKTPYDTIRGDVRDYDAPNCEAVSLWQLQRHGNRNPGDSVIASMKYINSLRDEIVTSYDEGRSQLCAQDVEAFRKFIWNSTMEQAASYLTGQGYEEIYEIGSRIRQRYPELMNGIEEDYYFRPTNEQRTITTGAAFIHGFREGTNLTDLILNAPLEKQDIIRPYIMCDRYQTEVKGGPALDQELQDYENLPPYLAIRDKVQQRLGITTALSPEDIYSFYEFCRFYRSWSDVLRSPWCSVFTDEDLVVLEYRDDLRHYWRNGYGSWVNVYLGAPVLKDLFETFRDVVEGDRRKVTAYFTHDTMMEMAFCALGLFNDFVPLRGSTISENRVWRTSQFSAFSTNLMAVLNKCRDSPSSPPEYRVQFLVNEKEVEICKPPGCSWQEFESRFQQYNNSNFDFCDPKFVVDFPEIAPSSASVNTTIVALIVIALQVSFLSWW